MGLITRHPGAPFLDTEILSAGTEEAPDGLEFDVNAFYLEFNGATDDVNLATLAGLSGTKLAVATLTAAKFAADAFDATVLLDDSIPDSKVNDGALTVAKIEANALSSGESTLIPTVGDLNQDDFEELASDTIVSTKGSGAVLVVWQARLVADFVSAAAGASQFRLKRDATVLLLTANASRMNGAISETTISIAYMDTGRPGGVSIGYSIEGKQASGEDNEVQEQRLTLVNLGA